MRYHSKVNYFIISFRNISLQRCYQNGFLRIGVERRQTKELAICDCHNGGDTLVKIAEALVL